MIRELKLVDFGSEKYYIGNSDIEYSFVIKVDPNRKIEEEFDELAFNKCVKVDKNNKPLAHFRNEVASNFYNLVDVAKYIRIDFGESDILSYINNNPCLKNKRIVLGNPVSIKQRKKISDLLDKFKGMEDNIYVYLVGNNDYVSLNVAKKTMDVLYDCTKQIKRLNLSPLENIMFAYDMVVRKEIKEEDEEDDRYEARDLSRVLFGDKCECAGFAHMFSALLDYLDIPNEYVELVGEGPRGLDNYGHARNVVHVRDEKYDIDGVYYFDPTMDSQLNHTNNIEQYTHFLRTKEDMDRLIAVKDESGVFHIVNFYDDNLQYFYSNLTDYVDLMSGAFDCGKYKSVIRTINYMGKLSRGHEIISSKMLFVPLTEEEKEKIKREIDLVQQSFRTKVSGERYIRLLLNVKMLKNCINPYTYNYSLRDLSAIINYSSWDLSEYNRFYTNDDESRLDNICEYVKQGRIVDNMQEFNYLRRKQ